MKEVLEKAFGESAILPLAHVSRHGISAMQQRCAALTHLRHEFLVTLPRPFPTVAHQDRAKNLIFDEIFA
ncbi:hypothetical protein [Pandoraea fibrosis]|uniref:hypothetical protein n=1 Tax=Pandoraea fibrosis TaxID=1891094 RepID=UPI001241CC72|nr:hypothetical protein [Pandoraea fibrosis]